MLRYTWVLLLHDRNRGGIYHVRMNASDGVKRRKPGTKRIGYPFRLYAKKLEDDLYLSGFHFYLNLLNLRVKEV
jgi:hypothetical protein